MDKDLKKFISENIEGMDHSLAGRLENLVSNLSQVNWDTVNRLDFRQALSSIEDIYGAFAFESARVLLEDAPRYLSTPDTETVKAWIAYYDKSFRGKNSSVPREFWEEDGISKLLHLVRHIILNIQNHDSKSFRYLDDCIVDIFANYGLIEFAYTLNCELSAILIAAIPEWERTIEHVFKDDKVCKEAEDKVLTAFK